MSTDPQPGAAGRRHPKVETAGIAAFGSHGIEALLDATPNSVLVIDEHGVIRAANPSVLIHFGYTPQELVGRKVNILMPPQESEQHDAHMEAYRHTGIGRIIGIGRTVIGRRRDGTAFPLHLSVGEFMLDGRRHFVGICHDATTEQERLHRIRELATYDDLTGLLNRRSLIADLGEQLELGGPRAPAVLFMDLDGFKQINDRYGHSAGDEVLRVMAERFRSQLRDGDKLARVGGDEFVAVIPTQGNAAVATDVASRLNATSQEPVEVGGHVVPLTVSIGISLAPDDGRTADELIASADIAMYEAKRSRRRTPQRYAEEFKSEANRRFDLHSRLRAAFERGEFTVHYQPEVELASGRVCAIEALVRWYDPEHGLRYPGEFLSVVVGSGLMPRFSLQVLQTACRDNIRLMRAGVADVPVSVNITAASFASADTLDVVTETLEQTGLPADRLVLEMVEDDTLNASDTAARANAESLAALGVTVVVDDFGTGHSSFSGMREHRFAGMKIDRSFINTLPGGESDRALAAGMIELAHGLRLYTVAEGVETAAQHEFLLEQGCDVAQGWFYTRALPIGDLITWIADRG